MLPSTWRLPWLELWRSWSSGGIKALEEMDLWRSWNAGGAGVPEEPELCRNGRMFRKLMHCRPNQSKRTHVIKHPKTYYQAPGVRHGWNAGGAGALEELKLWRSWISGGAGTLEKLEFLRSRSSAGTEWLLFSLHGTVAQSSWPVPPPTEFVVAFF